MGNGKKDKHITLKEAAVLSGYSSDYLGQLIRKGKLEGEQVYMNTAWMTTEVAVLDYLNNTKKVKTSEERSFVESLVESAKKNWDLLYTYFLYTIIFLNILFLIVLFFILSVSIENYFEKRDVETLSVDKAILIDSI